VLFGLVMGMAFTGYLLPWDQKAYFATAVGTNAVSEIPWIGDAIKRLLRGGTEMGTLTISRFFMLHVFLIPGCKLTVSPSSRTLVCSHASSSQSESASPLLM
jgi:quinol-cytochrome oxidoreductase complex cytochrome b subunit